MKNKENLITLEDIKLLEEIHYPNIQSLYEFYERYQQRKKGLIDPKNDKFLIEDAITEIKLIVSPILFDNLKEVVSTALSFSKDMQTTKQDIIDALNNVNKVLDKTLLGGYSKNQ